MGTIDDKYKPMVKEKVSRLDGVGVIEKSGVKIVKELGVDKAVDVVDPVFLLDKEEWDNIVIETFNEKYMILIKVA